MDMPVRNAEVTIVGGGIIGLSIAYHLAKMGCCDVLVLEKAQIGSGSTGKCPGGIRQQFSNEMNVRLSMESVKFFQSFEEETGHPADFRQHGYLILVTKEDEEESFRQSIALQRRLGLEVYLLLPREVKAMAPYLNVEDIVAATFCPTDGYADPTSVVNGLASSAKRLGIKIMEETEVTGIKVREGTVKSVQTSRGEVLSSKVVNAAGAYGRRIGKMVGVNIPIHPSRRHVFVTSPLGQVPRNIPMIIDFTTGFWFRREGPGLIFGMRNPEEPEGYDISVDWGFLTQVSKAACHRAPFMNDIGVIRAWAGLHEDTPDYNGMVGAVPGIEGLYIACGFSGHGFMHSPAVGKLVAQLLLTNKTFVDISDMSPLRFQDSKRKDDLAVERNFV